MVVSSAKFTILISWSPICMSLILLYLYTFNSRIDINKNCNCSGHNNAQQHLEWTTMTKSLDNGKSVRKETIYFNFRLDIGVSILNKVNEFFPVTKVTTENEIPEKKKSQSILSKALRQYKEITARVYQVYLKDQQNYVLQKECVIQLFY